MKNKKVQSVFLFLKNMSILTTIITFIISWKYLLPEPVTNGIIENKTPKIIIQYLAFDDPSIFDIMFGTLLWILFIVILIIIVLIVYLIEDWIIGQFYKKMKISTSTTIMHVAHVDQKLQKTEESTSIIYINDVMYPTTSEYLESEISFTIGTKDSINITKNVPTNIYDSYKENKYYLVEIETNYLLGTPINSKINLTNDPKEIKPITK